MSSSDVAIRVHDLSKCYQIYEVPRDRLKQFFLPRLQRLGGLRPHQYFREFWAVKNVSFEIKKGETVGIVGKNGSGKSTLLQLICETLTPTNGEVVTHGRIAALLELGSGFNPEFTGRENVYMNAAVLGLSRDEIDARFQRIAEFADIGDFIDQPVKMYSSGMTLRLAFAVIAHVDADILVVDEALAVGDALFTQKCMRFLRNFMKTGSILFVSHDAGSVVNLCNRAIMMSHGEIVKEGSPKDVMAYYLTTLYGESQSVDGINAVEQLLAPETNVDISEYRDMREGMLNASSSRNDIEIFRFEPDNDGFGSGGGKVVSVRLTDRTGRPFSWIVGGEDVLLEIQCEASQPMQCPIIGFQFKDRLGQVIFADNTFIPYRLDPRPVGAGGRLVARFEFRLPVLPTGDYSVTVALAEGSQDNHVQHHWMHDALIIRVHASAVCQGLIGVPMKNIQLQAVGADSD